MTRSTRSLLPALLAIVACRSAPATPEAPELDHIAAGAPFPRVDLLPEQMSNRKDMLVVSWAPPVKTPPLRRDGKPCEALSGVLRDGTKPANDANATWTALALRCGNELLRFEHPQKGKVWVVPIYNSPEGKPDVHVAIRAEDPITAGESLVWMSVIAVLHRKADENVVDAIVRESAFREGANGVAERVLEVTGLDTFKLDKEPIAPLLATYKCAFVGATRPKRFSCSYETKAKQKVDSISAGYLEGQGYSKDR